MILTIISSVIGYLIIGGIIMGIVLKVSNVSLDVFIKGIEKQIKKAINVLEAKNETTIEDRFILMDLEAK